MTLTFDASQLEADLAGLPVSSRGLFATLCARRLAPAYAAYAADDPTRKATLFAELHERLWRSLAAGRPQAPELAASAEAALSLLPSADDSEAAFAEDAVAALVYALRAASGDDAQNAVWAAERVYNAVDAFIQVQHVPSGSQVSERSSLTHPLVQAELKRQSEDLVSVAALAQGRWPASRVETLRRRVDTDAQRVFR